MNGSTVLVSRSWRQGWAPESLGKGINQLQFKIKDQDYFLAFVEEEKRWYVLAPTAQGVHRIPVYVEARGPFGFAEGRP